VIYGGVDSKGVTFEGLEQALSVPKSQLRLFGKPESYKRRRMGVAVAAGETVEEARERARLAAQSVTVRRG
jgi:phosphoribosylglycinamide formyltransferase 2